MSQLRRGASKGGNKSSGDERARDGLFQGE